jgi:hypothetical protein
MVPAIVILFFCVAFVVDMIAFVIEYGHLHSRLAEIESNIRATVSEQSV